MKMKYETEIHIWSAIGNTPITNRKGAYCDLLLKTRIQAESPADAVFQAKKLAKQITGAYSGHYFMVLYPNQNLCSRFFKV